MKISVVQLMVWLAFSGISVAYDGHGQDLLNKSITINLEEAKLRVVLTAIEKQADVQFVYSSRAIKSDRKVSVNSRAQRLAEVLTNLLGPLQINYRIVEGQIILNPANVTPVKQAQKFSDTESKIEPTPLEASADATVTGKVTDEKGSALSGVSIVIKGTNKGTTSGADGNFSLTVADLNQTLVFSFIGFKTQELALNGRSQLTVTLAESVSDLDEMVVVGYGTQKKSDLTGAVGVVNVAKSLTSRPATNVQELLAGTVPGLNISKGSGAVGSGASLNIRGTSTIGSSSGVLVLIDGIPGNISTLNPNDIESISVLKDAASAAIYGSRAANGVLLVTTKKGKSGGKPTVDINSSVGVQNPQFMLDFVGAEDYMRLWDQVLVNDGKQPLYGEQGIQDLKNGKYPDNKWYKEIYKRNTIINNNSLAVSGGTDMLTYRLSGSYDYQEGTLPNDTYNRFVFRPDMTIKLSDKISLGANIQYTETYITQPQNGNSNVGTNIIDLFSPNNSARDDANRLRTAGWQSEAARAAPISPIYTKNGQFGVGSSMVGNPVAAIYQGGYFKEKARDMFSVFEANYSPLKNWNIKGMFSRYTSDIWWTNRLSTYNLYDDNGNVAAQRNLVSTLRETSGSSSRNMFQAISDYAYSVNKHSFKILGGYSQEYFKVTAFSAFRDNMPFNVVDVLNMGSSTNMQNAGGARDVAIQSVFGRLNYEYDGRYLFQANIRSDGSSRFAKGYRWGYFPSFSAGWNIHQESFFKADWVSQLKLRGSWGILGDAEKISNYATAQVLEYNAQRYGFNGVVVPGAFNNVAINPTISWEESKQTNVGLDLGFFANRLTVSVDYFINNRDKILYQNPAPAEFGLAAPLSNLLKMTNRGWEFLASYRDRKGDFNWAIDGNFGFSKNEVTDMAGSGPWKGTTTFTDLGTQYNLPYGLQDIGLFQSQEEITQSPSQGTNIFPGNIKYKDQNGDNKIDGNDMVVLYTKVPIRFGTNLSFGWKNLDFSANAYGALNAFRYMSGYEGWAFYLSQNARPLALDNWTPENPDATYPRLSTQYTANDTRYSSYWMRKADYLKIQNAQIGFTFPQPVLTRLKMKYLRLYVSGQNLATISKYPGFDPEGSWYPLSRTYSFGANIKF